MKYLGIAASTLIVSLLLGFMTVHAMTSAYRSGGVVSLTFDDATSLEWNGYQIAQKYGFRGTLFVTTDTVGTDWGLTWDQIRTMQRNGWEIGAHTKSHPHLASLDQNMLAEELEYPLQKIYSETGTFPHTFASPFGEYNAHVLQEIGTRYELHVDAWNTDGATDGLNTFDSINPLVIHRIDMSSPELAKMDICGLVQTAADKHLWLVLLFHTVTYAPPGAYQVSAESFEKDMQCLKSAVDNATVRVTTVRSAYELLTD